MVDIKDIGCKLVHYLYMWCFYTSVFTLAAVSYERWLKFNKVYYLIFTTKVVGCIEFSWDREI